LVRNYRMCMCKHGDFCVLKSVYFASFGWKKQSSELVLINSAHSECISYLCKSAKLLSILILKRNYLVFFNVMHLT
jgi:hypothetical protein